MPESKSNPEFRLAHTMIRVRDLELSLKFYIFVTGFVVYYF